MEELKDYKYIFNKQDYLIRNTGKSIGRKLALHVHFNTNSSVIDRWNGFKRDSSYTDKRLVHYLLDDKLCIRTLVEYFATNNSFQSKGDIVIEVFNSINGYKNIELYLGNLLKILYDKFGWNWSKVKFSGNKGKVNLNNVKRISQIPYTQSTTYIMTQHKDLLPIAKILKRTTFKNAKEVNVDGKGLTHFEAVKKGFLNEIYYLHTFDKSDNRKNTITFIQKFISDRIKGYSKLKNIKYVAYFKDDEKELAELIGYLANARIVKDNGRDMSGKDIGYYKDRGQLIYVGTGASNNIKAFLERVLI